MKKLTIKKITEQAELNDINDISLKLDTVEAHKLEYVPWAAYPYKPVVIFSIAYSHSAILIKFYVQEQQIRALNHKINSSIWEDSCVEFFISFDDNAHYYNIEFNCIGTGLIGYGKSKMDRKLLDDQVVNQVKTLSKINAEKGKKVSWELTMVIPFEVFTHSNITDLPSTKCRANFYKCGDLLPEPHFICWSNVQSESPNFHLPDYFGQLQFEPV